MEDKTSTLSWFGSLPSDIAPLPAEPTDELARLWQTFLTARLALGLVLVLLETTLYFSGTSPNPELIGVTAVYFGLTLVNRMRARPRLMGVAFAPAWVSLVGLDVLAFAALQLMQQSGSINYTPLFALPILLASVLGTLRLALGTAASITMLLLGIALLTFMRNPAEGGAHFVQPALSGLGYFAIAFLANQLATRLASEGQRARLSQMAARIQRQVNELVIESLPDGVLIVDGKGTVRAANPAARQLLGASPLLDAPHFNLRDEPGWRALVELTRVSLGSGHGQEEDVTIRHEGHGPRKVHARTRLTGPQDVDRENLCVLFLQDQRELEARMRTEKLASMGRMSTAVAHEIRNPLAAIVQANALLEEDIVDPHQKQLTSMVSQNAKRLEKIVDDILNVARVQTRGSESFDVAIQLGTTAQRICQEWCEQNKYQNRVSLALEEAGPSVYFDAEHLRRILINLLDNAKRYATQECDAIQVWSAGANEHRTITLSVWSDGAPMEQSVERHLFEPFFSSESRSSGLGLYITRELCEGHGATIVYRRSVRTAQQIAVEGNEFTISFMQADG